MQEYPIENHACHNFNKNTINTATVPHIAWRFMLTARQPMLQNPEWSLLMRRLAAPSYPPGGFWTKPRISRKTASKGEKIHAITRYSTWPIEHESNTLKTTPLTWIPCSKHELMSVLWSKTFSSLDLYLLHRSSSQFLSVMRPDQMFSTQRPRSCLNTPSLANSLPFLY